MKNISKRLLVLMVELCKALDFSFEVWNEVEKIKETAVKSIMIFENK